jgi:hypothetical protein
MKPTHALAQVYRYLDVSADPKGDKLLVFLDVNGEQVMLQLHNTAADNLLKTLEVGAIPHIAQTPEDLALHQ